MPNLPWRDAILKVLDEAAEPIHYNEIAQEIIDKRYRTSVGATPARTVAAMLGQPPLSSQVHRPQRGFYELKQTQDEPDSMRHPAQLATATTPSVGSTDVDEAAHDAEEMGLINAFGMFWRRGEILWKATPKILGVQQSGSTPVDFSVQAGVYLLYDGNRVVYVGRVNDGRLGKRLWEHTRDRLTARWDRFSWFGVRPVFEDGTLAEVPESSIRVETLIATMEALLIEGLEPPQNRKQGDGFNAMEFIQATDPAIEKQRHQALLSQLGLRLADRSGQVPPSVI